MTETHVETTVETDPPGGPSETPLPDTDPPGGPSETPEPNTEPPEEQPAEPLSEPPETEEGDDQAAAVGTESVSVNIEEKDLADAPETERDEEGVDLDDGEE